MSRSSPLSLINPFIDNDPSVQALASPPPTSPNLDRMYHPSLIPYIRLHILTLAIQPQPSRDPLHPELALQPSLPVHRTSSSPNLTKLKTIPLLKLRLSLPNPPRRNSPPLKLQIYLRRRNLGLLHEAQENLCSNLSVLLLDWHG